METEPIVLDENMLNNLSIKKPSLNWSKNDYYNIKDTWIQTEKKVPLTKDFYDELITYPLYNIDILDNEKNEFKINTKEMMDFIVNVRNEIDDNYIIKAETYEKFYDRYDSSSTSYERIKQFDYELSIQDKLLIKTMFSGNAMMSMDISSDMDRKSDVVYLPNVRSKYDRLIVKGFLLNKNGANRDKGIKFLNGLISDKVQIKLYRLTDFKYPVNKYIEKDIEKIEKERNINKKAIELRKYIIEKIKKEDYLPNYKYFNTLNLDFYNMFKKDLLKLILNKNIDNKEINNELKRVENKYNIWLKEKNF
ncbi:MAG: hypothetical protein FH751_16470 [Firmicutes bacterium]|nr:hypothetical protein [Bacillota bacterium]